MTVQSLDLSTFSVHIRGYGWSVRIVGGKVRETEGFLSPAEMRKAMKTYHAITKFK